MTRKSSLCRAIAVVGLISSGFPAPSNAAVVEIDSLQNRIPWDQLATFGLSKSGRNQASYVTQAQIAVDAATYEFNYVAGAWNPWGLVQPSASCAQTLDCGTGVGWISSVSFDSGPGTALVHLGTETRWYSPALALADAQQHGPYLHTFAAPATLRFFVSDTVYDEVGQIYWNLGKVSLQVTAVPEPESYAMLLAGITLLAGVARRRTRRSIDEGVAHS